MSPKKSSPKKQTARAAKSPRPRPKSPRARPTSAPQLRRDARAKADASVTSALPDESGSSAVPRRTNVDGWDTADAMLADVVREVRGLPTVAPCLLALVCHGDFYAGTARATLDAVHAASSQVWTGKTEPTMAIIECGAPASEEGVTRSHNQVLFASRHRIAGGDALDTLWEAVDETVSKRNGLLVTVLGRMHEGAPHAVYKNAELLAGITQRTVGNEWAWVNDANGTFVRCIVLAESQEHARTTYTLWPPGFEQCHYKHLPAPMLDPKCAHQFSKQWIRAECGDDATLCERTAEDIRTHKIKGNEDAAES